MSNDNRIGHLEKEAVKCVPANRRSTLAAKVSSDLFLCLLRFLCAMFLHESCRALLRRNGLCDCAPLGEVAARRDRGAEFRLWSETQSSRNSLRGRTCQTPWRPPPDDRF